MVSFMAIWYIFPVLATLVARWSMKMLIGFNVTCDQMNALAKLWANFLSIFVAKN
jgi:hypothetical protein